MLIRFPGCHGAVSRANRLDERIMSQSNVFRLGSNLTHKRPTQRTALGSEWHLAGRRTGEGCSPGIWERVMHCSQRQPWGEMVAKKVTLGVWEWRRHSSVLGRFHRGWWWHVGFSSPQGLCWGDRLGWWGWGQGSKWHMNLGRWSLPPWWAVVGYNVFHYDLQKAQLTEVRLEKHDYLIE